MKKKYLEATSGKHSAGSLQKKKKKRTLHIIRKALQSSSFVWFTTGSRGRVPGIPL
jgi:hypothetical protein